MGLLNWLKARPKEPTIRIAVESSVTPSPPAQPWSYTPEEQAAFKQRQGELRSKRNAEVETFEPLCPHCNARQSTTPKGKRKCEFCGQPIHTKTQAVPMFGTPFVTSEQAFACDEWKVMGVLGATLELWRAELDRCTSRPLDALWQIGNRLKSDAMSSGDWNAVEMIQMSKERQMKHQGWSDDQIKKHLGGKRSIARQPDGTPK